MDEIVNKGIDDATASGEIVQTAMGEEMELILDEMEESAAHHGNAASDQLLSDTTKKIEEILAATKHDVGAPFTNDNIAAIKTVFDNYPDQWARLKAQLKELGVSPRDLEKILKRKLRIVGLGEADSYSKRVGIYGVKDHKIVQFRRVQDTEVVEPLATFEATIHSQELHDDGISHQIFYSVSGITAEGKLLPSVAVNASEFQNLNFIGQSWGNGAVILAGKNTKDHLRAGIQLLSGITQSSMVYRHTGWRIFEGEYYFLTSSGGIGADGLRPEFRVQLDPGLEEYSLPEPTNEPATYIRQVFQILEVTKPELAWALLGNVFRAPLEELNPVDYTFSIVGVTGSLKTSFAAVGQSFFGKGFSDRKLPTNWHSTANAMERVLFICKDVISTGDDFAPQGSAHDQAEWHRKGDRIIRAQGNKSGRQRAKTDGTLRGSNFSRTSFVSTAEDNFRGHSISARCWIIEVEKTDIYPDKLRIAQVRAADGIYAAVMATYVQWLAPQMPSLKPSIVSRQIELRDHARTISGKDQHRRGSDIQASMMTGLESFLRFAVEKGAIASAEKIEYEHQAWEALFSTAKKQGNLHAAQDPVITYLECLATAFSVKSVHVVHKISGKQPEDAQTWGWYRHEHEPLQSGEPNYSYEQKGQKIGWLDGNSLLLLPGAAYAAAQKIARDQNTSIPLQEKSLHKRLVERGFIEPTGTEKRNTRRMTIEGTEQTVIVFKDAEQIFLRGEKSVSPGPQSYQDENNLPDLPF